MGLATVVFMLLPWIDRSPVKSIRYKGLYCRAALASFVISFIALGWLGTQPATEAYTRAARIFTVIYFAFFALMPIYTAMDKHKAEPERVS